MKLELSDDDRKDLLLRVFPEIVRLKPAVFPPDKGGNCKKAGARLDLAAAAWTARYIDTLEYVLRDEDRRDNASPSEKGPAVDDVPF